VILQDYQGKEKVDRKREGGMRIAIDAKESNMNEGKNEILDWLLEGDPAIRYQVRRDLLGEDERTIYPVQKLIAETGWGARFLTFQEPSGLWGGGIYSPKWISTTYTMLTLRRLGVPADNPQGQKGCKILLNRGFYKDGGINFFKSMEQSEVCVTGMVLSILAHFRYQDVRIEELVEHLLMRQMDDWGWNCEDYKGDKHSSFHTTLSVLEGLLEYQKAMPEVNLEVNEAQIRGHEFLLRHRLFKSHRTGEIVNQRMLRMPFPPRWFYDVTKALDYFQDYYRWKGDQDISHHDRETVELYESHDHDMRFKDGIEVLRSKRKRDGRWNMMRGPSGRVYFDMEPAGKPGRWNTLRGMRILKWWEGGP
jgi:hypothetical protein